MDFINLTCPNCGGKLQITNDIERFSCVYCGNEHIVKRGVGTIQIEPVLASLQNLKAGTDRTASELALKRLGPEIEEFKKKVDAFRRKCIPGGNYCKYIFQYLEKDLTILEKYFKGNNLDKKMFEIFHKGNVSEWQAIIKYFSKKKVDNETKKFLEEANDFYQATKKLEEYNRQYEHHRNIVDQL